VKSVVVFFSGVGSAVPNVSPVKRRGRLRPLRRAKNYAPSPPRGQERQGKIQLNSLWLHGFLAPWRVPFFFASAFAPSRLRGFPHRGYFPMGWKRSLRSGFLRPEYRSKVPECRDHGQDAHATTRNTVPQGRTGHAIAGPTPTGCARQSGLLPKYGRYLYKGDGEWVDSPKYLE
jgi:hypothetical protein